MYPQTELTRLARRKGELRQRIGGHRDQCVAAAHRVTRPLVWLDRARDLWRQFPPETRHAAGSLGWLGLQAFSRHASGLHKLWEWTRLAVPALRILGRHRRSSRSA